MIDCQYCGKECALVMGKDIYNNHRYTTHLPFWRCRQCKAWTGCFPATTRPKGEVADSVERQHRKMLWDRLVTLRIYISNRRDLREDALVVLREYLVERGHRPASLPPLESLCDLRGNEIAEIVRTDRFTLWLKTPRKEKQKMVSAFNRPLRC